MGESGQQIEPQRAALVHMLRQRYGIAAERVRVVWAPYRVCPLGAHIDHQFGPVTSMAIDRGVLLAYAPSHSRSVCLASCEFAGETKFELDSVPDPIPGDWGNLARGAVRSLQREFRLDCGLTGIVTGAHDSGGLSSSAAIGVALLLALEDVNGLAVQAEDNIRFHCGIENDYLGLRIGVLDQASVLLARRECLTQIDCRTLEHHWHAYPAGGVPFAILLVFSGVRKPLASTGYNRRVEQCRRAARELAARRQAAASRHADSRPVDLTLGDIEPDVYRDCHATLDAISARRAAHFFTEVARVQQGITAWRAGDMCRFGELVTESGASSINNYECGSPPLIALYELLVQSEGVFGARFSGAGFRGCCLALADPSCAEDAGADVVSQYARQFPDLAADAQAIVCRWGGGARLI